MSTLRCLLVGGERSVLAVSPTSPVVDAVSAMCDHHVGALLVLEEGRAVGILTARDVLRRVVLEGRAPSDTTVASIMTKEVTMVVPDLEPEAALSLMEKRHCHHLPVLEDGHVVGIVSEVELVAWTRRFQEDEIRAMHDYVSGTYAR